MKGEYFLRGHDGHIRKVVYEADKDGFRAHVDTNEFGVVSHKPTDAVISQNRRPKVSQSFSQAYRVFPVSFVFLAGPVRRNEICIVQQFDQAEPNAFDQTNVFKPEKPLERDPRPSLYIGDLRPDGQ